jgi:hypothetical protein
MSRQKHSRASISEQDQAWPIRQTQRVALNPDGPDSDESQAWNIPRQLEWKSFKLARDPAATIQEIFLCGTKLQPLRHLLSLFLRTLDIYDPSLPSVATPIPHPYALAPSTSTPHRSGNSPSHTSHMVFLHGPRPRESRDSTRHPSLAARTPPRLPTQDPAWSPTLR